MCLILHNPIVLADILLMLLGFGLLNSGLFIKKYNRFTDPNFLTLSVPLMIITVSGLWFFVASLIGCVGAFLRSRNWLKGSLYLIIVAIIMQLMGGIIIVTEMNNRSQDGNAVIRLQKHLYQSLNDVKNRQFWNELQRDYKCCGVLDLTDWHGIDPYNYPPRSCRHLLNGTYFKNGCWRRIKKDLDKRDMSVLAYFTFCASILALGYAALTIILFRRIKRNGKV